jgi:hypothetical protein
MKRMKKVTYPVGPRQELKEIRNQVRNEQNITDAARIRMSRVLADISPPFGRERLTC